MKGQHDVISRVRAAYKKNPERKRGLALIGALVAQDFKAGDFNYESERFRLAYRSSEKNYVDLIKECL